MKIKVTAALNNSALRGNTVTQEAVLNGMVEWDWKEVE